MNDGSTNLNPFPNAWTRNQLAIDTIERVAFYSQPAAFDLVDIDLDGYEDLLFQGIFDENDNNPDPYFTREQRLYYFQNTGNQVLDFSPTGTQIYERDLRRFTGQDNTYDFAIFTMVDMDFDGNTDLIDMHATSVDACGYCGNYTYLNTLEYQENLSEIVTGIELDQIKTEVYPNPSSQMVSFQFENGNHEQSKITLMNSLGEVLLIDQFYGNQYEINVQGYPSGLYYFQIETGERLSAGSLVLK